MADYFLKIEWHAGFDFFCWKRTKFVGADLELAELKVGRNGIDAGAGVVTEELAISEREGVAFAYTVVNTVQSCRFCSQLAYQSVLRMDSLVLLLVG